MKLSRRRLESRAGAVAFQTIRRWLSKKNLAEADRIGTRLGRIAFRLGKERRRRALANLELAFPEIQPAERSRIARGVFEHFGRLMGDFVRTDTRSVEEVLGSISFDGLESVEELIPRGKGLIIVTGHFGNWERMAHYLALAGYPVSVVVRDANDSELNDLVVKLRQSAGLELIPRGSAARSVLKKLKNNELVAMLPDQNSDEAFLPFFGKPCGTVLGPAVLAQRAGVPLYVAFCYRAGEGEFRVRRSEIIDPVSHPDMTPEEIMTRFNLDLESIVREFPEQYLWIHNRWKSARTKGLV